MQRAPVRGPLRIHRVLGRAAVLVFVFVLTLLALTGTASAHAQLLGTDPHANDVLATAPLRVTLTFGEPVEVADNAIEVFDDHLTRVDNATVSRVATDVNKIWIGLRPDLHYGTYVVSWHVSSADTHPVSGRFRFSVGAPSQVTANAPTFGRNDSAGLMLGFVRVLGYAGLILAPGALLITLALWPAGLAERRTRRTLSVGLILLALSAIGSMLLEGVWASGEPLRAMWLAPSSLDSHSHKFDTLYAFRSYLLVIFGVLLAIAVSARPPAPATTAARTGSRYRRSAASVSRPLVPSPVMLVVLAVTTLLLMATWTLAGHSATGLQTPVAVAVNMLHLLAMTIWLGGLAVLSIGLRPAARAADLAAVLPRFSRVAFTCVVVLVLTGSYQAWREVGTIPALYRTTFGRVLLVKIGAVLVIIALGNLARRWVQRHLNRLPGSAGGPRSSPARVSEPGRVGGTATVQKESKAPPYGDSLPVRALHRGLLAELVVGLVVLGMTAALVVTVPARDSYVVPFARTLTAPGLQVSVRVDKPRLGDAVLHLIARSSNGRPVRVTGLRGTMSLPKAKLGPLALRLSNPAGAASNGREDIGMTFSRTGSWVIALTVQTSPVDATVFSVTVPVK